MENREGTKVLQDVELKHFVDIRMRWRRRTFELFEIELRDLVGILKF
jgi:hypothetical protein